MYISIYYNIMKTTSIIIIIFLLILCFYITDKEEFVSTRDYLGEVLLTGRMEREVPEIIYSNKPPSFKLSDNKISSN